MATATKKKPWGMQEPTYADPNNNQPINQNRMGMQQPALATQTRPTVTIQRQNVSTPDVDYRSELIRARERLMQPVQPFQYNREADPAYQSALAAARSNIAREQSATNARLRAQGQGRSSFSESLAQQVAARTMADLETNVVPALINQAYQRYLDEQNMRRAQLQDYAYITNMLSNLDQRAIENQLAMAELTGRLNYSPEIMRRFEQILENKQRAESPGATPEQISNLRNQTDQIRKELAFMGVNPDIVGADVDYQTALRNIARGIPTIQAQGLMFDQDMSLWQQQLAEQAQRFNQDLQNRQYELNSTQVMAALTGRLPDGTPTTAYQQQQLENLWRMADLTGTIPNELADMYGLPRGTATRAAKEFAMQNAVSRMNVANAAKNYELNRLLQIWEMTGRAPAGLQQYGIRPGQTLPAQPSDPYVPNLETVIKQLNQQFGEVDENGRVTIPYDKKENLRKAILAMYLPDDVTDVLLSVYGLPTKAKEEE